MIIAYKKKKVGIDGGKQTLLYCRTLYIRLLKQSGRKEDLSI